jgi:cell division protein FtsQ
MTGISDIFSTKQKSSVTRQAVPRDDHKKKPSLLQAIFGNGDREKRSDTSRYPVIKPVRGINSMAVKPSDPKMDSLSKLFGIKPDKTPLENLQDSIKKEKPHGEGLFGRLFRKMHVLQPKQVNIMPPRGTVVQNHPTRGVVMPNRVPSSTVRSINSPLSRTSFLGKLNRTGKKNTDIAVTTFVKHKEGDTVKPPKPKNMKEWLTAIRTNFAAIQVQRAAAANIHNTPIITRHGALGIPMRHQTQNKIRRQLYLSLGASGAEIRVPALPIFNASWRYISGLIMLASAAGMGYMVYAPEFQVTSVEVKGLNRLEPERIQPILDLANRPVIMVDAGLVRERVSLVLPELKDISVSVGFPASIVIELGERKPVLAWEYNDQISWIDKEGILIPVQGDGGELLTIKSDMPPPVLDIRERKEIFKAYASAGVQFTPQAKPFEDSTSEEEEQVYSGMIQVEPAVLSTAIQLSTMMPVGSQLMYNSHYGFGWNDQLQNLSVYIGQDLSDLDIKMNAYSAIMLRLQKDGIKPGMISLEHVHAPFYRLERQ